jgi:hypothetical protein
LIRIVDRGQSTNIDRHGHRVPDLVGTLTYTLDKAGNRTGVNGTSYSPNTINEYIERNRGQSANLDRGRARGRIDLVAKTNGVVSTFDIWWQKSPPRNDPESFWALSSFDFREAVPPCGYLSGVDHQ